jgi:hypothetical protein
LYDSIKVKRKIDSERWLRDREGCRTIKELNGDKGGIEREVEEEKEYRER